MIKIVQPKNDRQIEISLHEKLPMVEGGLIEATKAQSNEHNSIINLCYTGLSALGALFAEKFGSANKNDKNDP